jgi:O-succinylbenzoate synthase
MQMTINIKSITLRHIEIPLVSPFRTSFGTQTNKDCILLEIKNSEGLSGWSEIPVSLEPGYCYETIKTAWHIAEDFLIPSLKSKKPETGFESYQQFMSNFKNVRGHNLAKAGFEIAYWVLLAEQENKTLAEIIGSKSRPVPSGVSIGIQKNVQDLIKKINFFLDQKYKRIKIKIEPSYDIEVVKTIREELGYDFPLMVDANSAYGLKDIDHLKKLDDFNLMMIEQPLDYLDIIDHIKLQKEINTPICLDESIHSLNDTRKALESSACRIINIKVARVGGLMESKKISEFVQKDNNWKAWCGGMLETGIGRMVNIFLQTLPGFTLPGDTSGSDRYFLKDIIDPPVVVKNGYIDPPKNGSGLVTDLDMKYLEKLTLKEKVFIF